MPQTLGTWNNFASGTWHYYFAIGPATQYHAYFGAESDPDTVIVAGSSAAFITGGGGDDIILGGDAGDLLNGGTGDDRVWGQDGDDEIATSAGEDELFGGDGNDTLQLSEFSETGWSASLVQGVALQVIGPFFAPGTTYNVSHIAEFENVTGSNADDYIEGDRFDNVIEDSWFSGSWDDDTILALAGDDIIRVHGGHDIVDAGIGDDMIEVHGRWMDNHSLTGGAGADTFDFTGMSALQDGHFATVEDFSRAEGDHVLVSDDYVHDPSDGADLTLLGQASMWVTQSGSTATLRFDHDGDRQMDAWAIVKLEPGVSFDALVDVTFI